MIEPKSNSNFYVITGGPGVGKTTLLTELQNRNYSVVPEIARKLIKEQQENNGKALPWKDQNLYKKVMFDRSVSSFEQTEEIVNGNEITFFDRGFLDTICYARLINSDVDEQMEIYAKNWRYNKHVFVLPPWKDIYKTDNERKQDWKEAVLTFEKMCETYANYGYNIIETPKLSVNERADFIIGFIK
ncbi:AAA family ATPase [Flammeovirga kamogawensis]|uniref:AAA family ATPase n=1 Tax=Flammeovirga kamogawensis TaxID=373891 RepID=A0ABX8H251_9BACT|nr:AAA family ATPase [Flammeovirga kamogawensis]TRX70148.1 AAA family ATPase [Flammeovirga kamogawensis]